MRRTARSILPVALAVLAVAPAQTVLAQESPEQSLTPLEEFQRVDQKLQDIGWKMVRGNAPFCPQTVPSIGLLMQDMASFGSPAEAREAIGLTGDFAVQTAASGSPAALSGALSPNGEIARVGGEDPNSWPAEERSDWKRLTRLYDHVDKVLGDSGGIAIKLVGGMTVALAAVPVCATRFEIDPSSDRAVAEGKRVVIGQKFKALDYPEELFAAVVAHELAHNLLAHREWLDRNKRTRANVRETEREADRLMPWLLANAGYNPAAALQFFERYQPSSGSVLFIRGSHDKWQDRVAAVREELSQMETHRDADGRADWATHFRRQIDPNAGL